MLNYISAMFNLQTNNHVRCQFLNVGLFFKSYPYF